MTLLRAEMIESVNLNTIDLKSRVKLDDSRASIIVYPRVHMFSIDLSAETLSGGMGFSVPVMPITVIAEEAVNHDLIESKIGGIEIVQVLDNIRSMLHIKKFWKITVSSSSLRSHIGLGSTTQIVGAVILTTATVSKLKVSLDQIVSLGIGQVSGVGLSLLFNPGYVLELGYKTSEHPSPHSFKHPTINSLYAKYKGVVLRISPPEDWGVILAIPNTNQSLSGTTEVDFWSNILPTDKQISDQISFDVLMRLMPSLISGDFESFIESLEKITSNGTKPDELAIQSVIAKDVLSHLKSKYGFSSVSSLGPTLYAITNNEPSDVELSALKNIFQEYSFYYFSLKSFRSSKNELVNRAVI